MTVKCGLAVAILVTAAAAQKPAAGHTVHKKAKPPQPPVVSALPERMPPFVTVPLSPDQVMPSAPQVSFDGNELTIVANNSALSEILAAVKAQMGTDIDIPPTASGERIVANIGPGAPREVLASLLSWTDFDYIISTDGNSQSVQNIILTARGKLDALVGAGTETAAAHDDSPIDPKAPAKGKVRHMIGHEDTSRGKPPVLEAAAAPAEAAPAEQPAPTEAANSSEAAPPADATAAASTPATAAPVPPADSADAQAALAASSVPSSSGIAPVNSQATAASLDSGSTGGEMNHQIQDMQRLFEQRRQMQAQQNKVGQGQNQAPTVN